MPKPTQNPPNKIFSHKQKVALMKAAKERRQERQARAEYEEQEEPQEGSVVNDREGLSGATVNPLRSRFEMDRRKALEERRQRSQQPMKHRVFSQAIAWECFIDIQGPKDCCSMPMAIAMPSRPDWSSVADKDSLDDLERTYFQQWLYAIRQQHNPDTLNYYERNLEVWRQLWRVLEQANVVAVVGDARVPSLHLPASLYHYVTRGLRKPLIYILNKVDLVDARTLEAWEKFFSNAYPELCILRFTSSPQPGTVVAPDCQPMRKRKQKVKTKVNYNDYLNLNDSSPGSSTGCDNGGDHGTKDEHEWDEAPERHVVAQMIQSIIAAARQLHQSSSGLKLAMVGHPNVGKSSIINCLKGEKVVSTSSTPGHTKHLQTINVTPDFTVLDCPGLVFPYVQLPKSVQVVCGLFPVAQCQDPCSAVQYLCERLPLEKVYKLQKPDYCEPDEEWSAWMICESYAQQKGYFIRKGKGRPDANRAAREILKEAVSGQLTFFLRPPKNSAGAIECFRAVQELSLSPLQDGDLERHMDGLSEEEGRLEEEQEAEEDNDESVGTFPKYYDFADETKKGPSKLKYTEVQNSSKVQPQKPAKVGGTSHPKKQGRYTRRQAALDEESDSEPNDLQTELKKLVPIVVADHDRVPAALVPSRKPKARGSSKTGGAEEEDERHSGEEDDESHGEDEGTDALFRECHQICITAIQDETEGDDLGSTFTPIHSFEELADRRMGNGDGLTQELIAACVGCIHVDPLGGSGTPKPTPIQSECWAILLTPAPPDAVAISFTGSGKTLAYFIPIFGALSTSERTLLPDYCQPQALVIAPTRELCLQIATVGQSIVDQLPGRMLSGKWGSQWAIFCATGGSSPFPQRAALLDAQPDVLIATPGRLLTLCGHHRSTEDAGAVLDPCIALDHLVVMVLDEADRLLDLGFNDDIVAISSLIKPSKVVTGPVTVMTSATWPSGLQMLAAEMLRPGAVRITVGGPDLNAAKNVRQTLEALPNSVAAVRKRLYERVQSCVSRSKAVLVFVTYKKQARDIASYLSHQGIPALAIHGDLSQSARSSVLHEFQAGGAMVLVATDVAARGLDIPHLEYVINLSPGMSVEQYVHRIGRCGRRPGQVGTAYTFITDADALLLPELVPLLNKWDQVIPPAVMQMMRRMETRNTQVLSASDEEEAEFEAEQRQQNRERQMQARAQQLAKAHKQQKGRKGGYKGHR